MSDVFTLSEAKLKLSEIINRIIYKKEKITITKKGKKVAMVVPLEESKQNREEGLIKAKGVLADIDDSIEEMVNVIYEARKKETSREINL
jgi:prevent-host-death family protein